MNSNKSTGFFKLTVNIVFLDPFQSKRLKKFIKCMVYITWFILMLKIIYIIMMYVKPRHQNMDSVCKYLIEFL